MSDMEYEPQKGAGMKSDENDGEFIRGKKRLYTSGAKKKAAAKDLTLWSIDDAKIYGKAVEKNLLSEHRAILPTVTKKDISIAVHNEISQGLQTC